MTKNMKRNKLMVMMVLGLVASLLFTSVAIAQEPDQAAAPDDLPGSGWWTGVVLQNVGAAQATVQVTSYQMNSNTEASVSKTIPQNSSLVLLPTDMNLGAGFQGSAVVGADQPLNAIVNVTNRLVSGQGGVQGGEAAAQSQGVSAPATELRFPLVKYDHRGKTTTFYIQNAGQADATAVATFSVGGQTYTYNTPVIKPGKMVIVNPSAAGVPKGNDVSVGALTVTSAQPLAGMVLEHDAANPAKILQATRGFAPQDADTKVFAPIIKSEYNNRFTGLQVQNTTAAPIDITVTYKGGGGSCAGQNYTSSKTGLAAGASHTFVHLVSDAGNPMPVGCLAAATVDATGKVVAIVSESFTPAFVAGKTQKSTTFSAIANAAATANMRAPLYKENSGNKQTGLLVQNVGAANASNVVAVFVANDGSGTYTTLPQSIAAGAGKNFLELSKNAAMFVGNNAPPVGKNYGVSISADQPIVAIANESTYPFVNPPISQDNNNYEAFNN